MAKLKSVIPVLIGVSALADIVLLLAAIQARWFVSMSASDYLWMVWDSISLWAGRAVTIAGFAVPLAVYFIRRTWPREKTWKETVAFYVERISVLQKKSVIVIPAFFVLLAAAVLLAYALIYGKTKISHIGLIGAAHSGRIASLCDN
jgi:hypothetical protein